MSVNQGQPPFLEDVSFAEKSSNVNSWQLETRKCRLSPKIYVTLQNKSFCRWSNSQRFFSFFSEQNISELSTGSIRKRESFLTAENQQNNDERKKLKEESETAVDHTIYI